MEYIIKCGCGHRMKVDEDHFGQTGTCPKCKNELVITSNSVESSNASEPPSSEEESTDAVGPDGFPVYWKNGDVILGLYEVSDVLGQGGMGRVLKVYHRRWGIDLAVKSPKPATWARTKGTEAFVRECETWVNLSLHPHVVSCYYIRTIAGIPRVFAEYVEGGSLFQWIRDKRLYRGNAEEVLERILRISIQTAWGLHHAHTQGVVHCDVKSGNVLLTGAGNAKVTDFGLAKARAVTEEETRAAGAGALASKGGKTPAYCSPEQAQGLHTTYATDIWSWALCVFEMIARKVLWTVGPTAPEAFEQYLTSDRPNRYPPPMPPKLVELLRACMQPDPASRPKSMQQVAEYTKAIYQEVTGITFPFHQPKQVEALAQNLNNRAVSLLDLGKDEEAEELWIKALDAEASHPEASFNLGLMRWRSGRTSDAELLHRMHDVCLLHPNEHLPQYLMAQLHLERGDYVSALDVFETLETHSDEFKQIKRLISLAKKRLRHSRRLLRSIEAHADGVTAVSMSRDGKYAMTASEDNTLKIWSLGEAACIRTLQGHTGSVEGVALSEDGKIAFSSSQDRTLRLWEVGTGRTIRVVDGHRDTVGAVCLCMNGRRGLFKTLGNSIVLHDMELDEKIQVMEGHADRVTDLRVLPDASKALSASDDHTLRLWDLETGQCLNVLAGHQAPVRAVCVCADGVHAISGGDETTLLYWDLEEGRCVRVMEGHGDAVTSVAMSPDGRFALSGSIDRTLRLWDVQSGRCMRTYEGHSDAVTSVDMCENVRYAVSGARDNTIKLWDLGTAEQAVSASVVLSRSIDSEAAASADSEFQHALHQAEKAVAAGDPILAAGHVRKARLKEGFRRRPEAMQLWHSLYLKMPRTAFNGAWTGAALKAHTEAVNCIDLDRQGQRALSGSADGRLILWDLQNGTVLTTLEGHGAPVKSVSMSQDLRFALSGGEDQSIRLWDLASGQCSLTFEGMTGSVESVSISPCGKFVLAGGWDLTLWVAELGYPLRTFEGHTSDIISVAWSPDGRYAISGSSDETLMYWDIAAGEVLHTFTGHSGSVRAVCISRDGHYALSASSNIWGKPGRLRLWDLESGKNVRVFEGHQGPVSAVALTGDGHFAVSGSQDATVKLWDVSTGYCLRTLQGINSPVESLAISDDGRIALVGTQDGSVQTWNLDWELAETLPNSWDEQANAFVEAFLTLQTPFKSELDPNDPPDDAMISQMLTHSGKAEWTDDDIAHLCYTLGCAGLGWIHPDTVRQEVATQASKRGRFTLFSRRK
jgi:WD40 repeat protein